MQTDGSAKWHELTGEQDQGASRWNTQLLWNCTKGCITAALMQSTMLHFARFLSTPLKLYALNPISLFTSFLSKLQFFSCSEHFSTRCQNRTVCYISGRFRPGKPQIKPYNQPTEHTKKPTLNTLHTLNTPNTLNTLNTLNT